MTIDIIILYLWLLPQDNLVVIVPFFIESFFRFLMRYAYLRAQGGGLCESLPNQPTETISALHSCRV